MNKVEMIEGTASLTVIYQKAGDGYRLIVEGSDPDNAPFTHEALFDPLLIGMVPSRAAAFARQIFSQHSKWQLGPSLFLSMSTEGTKILGSYGFNFPVEKPALE